MKRLLSSILLVLLTIAGLYIIMAGGPKPCKPFAEFQRKAGSMSMFPERIYGPEGETVRFLDCGGVVNVQIERFDSYKR